MVILCQKFATKENLFSAPLIESLKVGIYIVKNKLQLCEKPVTDMDGKVTVFPFKNYHVAMKMLHS